MESIANVSKHCSPPTSPTSTIPAFRGEEWDGRSHSAPPKSECLIGRGSVHRLASQLEDRISEERSRSVEPRRSPSPALKVIAQSFQAQIDASKPSSLPPRSPASRPRVSSPLRKDSRLTDSIEAVKGPSWVQKFAPSPSHTPEAVTPSKASLVPLSVSPHLAARFDTAVGRSPTVDPCPGTTHRRRSDRVSASMPNTMAALLEIEEAMRSIEEAKFCGRAAARKPSAGSSPGTAAQLSCRTYINTSWEPDDALFHKEKEGRHHVDVPAGKVKTAAKALFQADRPVSTKASSDAGHILAGKRSIVSQSLPALPMKQPAAARSARDSPTAPVALKRPASLSPEPNTPEKATIPVEGDDEWTFPQTPSSLQNSVWGSKLWPSQSPVSMAEPDPSLSGSKADGEKSSTEGGKKALWAIPANTEEKANGQGYDLSASCASGEWATKSAMAEQLFGDMKAKSCTPQQANGHAGPSHVEYNRPVSFRMLAKSLLIIFLTLAAAVLAGLAFDRTFGPAAVPKTALQQPTLLTPDPSHLEGNATASLPVLSPSKQASTDDELAHATDAVHWGLEKLDGGWQAATQQLDKVSKSLLNGDAAEKEPSPTAPTANKPAQAVVSPQEEEVAPQGWDITSLNANMRSAVTQFVERSTKALKHATSRIKGEPAGQPAAAQAFPNEARKALQPVSGWRRQLAVYFPFFGALVAEVLGVWCMTKLLLALTTARCRNPACTRTGKVKRRPSGGCLLCQRCAAWAQHNDGDLWMSAPPAEARVQLWQRLPGGRQLMCFLRDIGFGPTSGR